MTDFSIFLIPSVLLSKFCEIIFTKISDQEGVTRGLLFPKIYRKTLVLEFIFLLKLQAEGLQLYSKRDPATGVFL